MNFLNTIRVRSVLLVLMLLVPALCLLYSTARENRHLQLTTTRNHLLNIAQHARQLLQDDIHSLQQENKFLATNPAILRMQEPACSNALATVLDSPSYLDSSTLDADGHVRCHASRTLPKPASSDYASGDDISQAIKNGLSIVGKPVMSNFTSKSILPVTFPLKDSGGKTLGVIITELDLGLFGETFVRSSPSPETVFMIWDKEGRLLYRFPDEEKLSGREFKNATIIEAAAHSGKEGILDTTGFDGLPRVIGYAFLDDYKELGITVGVSVPASTLYANADTVVSNAGLSALLLVLAGIVVTWVIARKWIWAPVSTLTAVVSRMTHGDFSARVGSPYWRGELGELAKGFDQMAANAESDRNTIVEINATLEQKVKERTASLEASERKFRNVLESAADAIVIVDRKGIITVANLKAEALFGYSREELLGESVDILIPESYRTVHHSLHDAFFDSGATRSMGDRGAVMGLRKDGSTFYAGISLSPVRAGDQVWVTAVIRDISGALAAEAELKRLNRTLRVLSRCNEVLVRAQDESELLDAICRLLVELGGYRLAWVGFVLHDQACTVSPVARCGAYEGYVDQLHITWADTERGRGPAGTAVREARTCINQDLIHSSSFAPWRELALARGFASSISLPLAGTDSVLGVLNIYSSEDAAFNAEEVNLLEELADDLSYGINSLREVARRQGMERQLQYQENFDTLTGLANRNLFMDRLKQAVMHSTRSGRQLAILLINLDRFKTINEIHGHGSGDLVLKQVAERILNVLHNGDTIARLSVDEFAVLLCDLPGSEDTSLVAHHLLDAIARPISIDRSEVFLTCSIGISLHPKDDGSAEELLQHAVAAMHDAKAIGGNVFHFYAPEMNQRAAMRLALDGALRRSLEHGEFQVYYQPKVNLSNGEIIGAEALVRWPHPEMGMIMPIDFIPLAEETGLIIPLGAWILNRTCQQIRQWLDAGLPVPPIAVNLSARQFSQNELVDIVRQALESSRLEPRMLALEITESTIMVDIERAVITLRKLKEIGVSISLDDFGTGYSSLSYLKRFHADTLKIDRSFVRDITTDADDAMIARSVIGLAHNLKMKVIAEGVETEGQMNYLRQNRCDEIQGYYFSPPLPADDFAQFLASGKTLHFPTGTSTSRQTLLLVDDEQNVLNALKRQLRADGYHILTAGTTAEGFNLLSLNEVQVIISDQRMPGMSGTEFLRHVKDLYPNTVRIVLSGYTELNSVTKAVNQGAIYKFLTKPWDEQELRKEVREAFRYHDSHKERRRPI